MRRQFPVGYTRDELSDEIALLYLLLERQRAFFECMAIVADRIERAATDRNRLNATPCLRDLVRCSAETSLEPQSCTSADARTAASK